MEREFLRIGDSSFEIQMRNKCQIKATKIEENGNFVIKDYSWENMEIIIDKKLPKYFTYTLPKEMFIENTKQNIRLIPKEIISNSKNLNIELKFAELVK
jgi:hypothetical protein